MPTAEAVPVGEPIKYQCQVIGLGDDPSNVRLAKVAIESYGPHFILES